MNASADIRARFRFFLENAGYATPPGRAACALALARAEVWAEEMTDEERLTVEWVDDQEPYDPGDVCTEDEARERFASNEWTGPFGCIVRLDGEVRASLWGIVVGPSGTSDPYCRVVAAELTDEVRHEEEREARERERAANHDIATTERSSLCLYQTIHDNYGEDVGRFALKRDDGTTPDPEEVGDTL